MPTWFYKFPRGNRGPTVVQPWSGRGRSLCARGNSNVSNKCRELTMILFFNPKKNWEDACRRGFTSFHGATVVQPWFYRGRAGVGHFLHVVIRTRFEKRWRNNLQRQKTWWGHMKHDGKHYLKTIEEAPASLTKSPCHRNVKPLRKHANKVYMYVCI